MRKRCTNSSCRKLFSLDVFGKCPHCGKVYPRLHRADEVILNLDGRNVNIMPYLREMVEAGYLDIHWEGSPAKIRCIKSLHEFIPGCSLKTAKYIAEALMGRECPIRWMRSQDGGCCVPVPGSPVVNWRRMFLSCKPGKNGRIAPKKMPRRRM